MADQVNTKGDIQMVENHSNYADTQLHDLKGGTPMLRSKADDLSIWRSVRQYKRVGFIAMAAAFCAALDGYRKLHLSSAPVHSMSLMVGIL